jgi:hypothetical protein
VPKLAAGAKTMLLAELTLARGEHPASAQVD